MSTNISDVSAFDILCGRYQNVLKGAELTNLATYLSKIGILGANDLQRIQTSQNKREVFAQVLAQKGSGCLVECSAAVDKFKSGVLSPDVTNLVPPSAKRSDNGDGRQPKTTQEQRGVALRSSTTDVQSFGSAKTHVDASLGVSGFVALFSALVQNLTEVLCCREMSWLVADIPLSHVVCYLPREYREKESVVKQISLRSLLEAFRELCGGKEASVGEAKRKGSRSLPPSFNVGDDTELERVTQALMKSEEKNLQMIKVTQEWSEECREKDNMVVSLQRQVRALEGERDTLLAKYSKAKHMLASNGEKELERQITELRTELFERKDVHNELMKERDSIISTLKAELTATKHTVEELSRKLAPNVEMANGEEPASCDKVFLLKENRELKDAARQLKLKIEELNKALVESKDELLATRINLQELQELQKTESEKIKKHTYHGRALDMANEQYHKRPKPIPRTQAMVTGYTHQITTLPVTSRSPDDDQASSEKFDRSSYQDLVLPPSLSLKVPSSHSSLSPRSTSPNLTSSHRPTSPNLTSSHRPTFPKSTLSHHPISPKSTSSPRSTSPPYSGASFASFEVPDTRQNEDSQNGVPGPAPQAKAVVETERKCPSCHHVFYTLAEREFQSHVAGCFK